METKKNPEVKLGRYRTLFFEIGLIVALFVSYLVLESKSTPKEGFDISSTTTTVIDEEIIPQTLRKEELRKIPKPPPPPINQIMVVTDNTELEHELEIETTEIDQNTKVDIQDYTPKPVVAEEEEEEEVYNFQVVESQAVYPGCEKYNDKQRRYMCFQKAIMKHVKKNFKYPEIAKEMGIQGRVIVQFVIDKNGNIGKITVLRGIDKHLDKEAVRIVKKLPKMQPAEQRGRKVPVSFMLPITFKLQ
jgi:protein TonB